MSTKFNRIRQITLPALSFKSREVAYVKCIGPLTQSDRVSQQDDGRKPATVMRVINLEDGGEYRLICPTLLVSALEDEGLDYLAKCYEIRVSPEKLPGKNYKSVNIYEIEDTAEDVGKLKVGIGEESYEETKAQRK